MDHTFYKKLKKFKRADWAGIHNEYQKKDLKKIIAQEWWHQKFYTRQKEDSGLMTQLLNIADKIISEIPFRRKLFFKTNGRFSLPNNPVAYFSDWLTGTCECLPTFRNHKKLSSKLLENYIDGKIDPDPAYRKLMGYPRVYLLRSDTKLLDLRSKNNKFYTYMKKRNVCNIDTFYRTIVKGKDSNNYLKTQSISQIALEKGFDGIIYRSVRIPKDWYFNGGDNIVLFDKNKPYRKMLSKRPVY